jgi:hypothetical protein
MSYYKDGTSNQYIFAEKHIPANRLGKCLNINGGTDTLNGGSEIFDCGVHVSRVPEVPFASDESANENNLLLYSPARTVMSDTFVIATEPSEGNSWGTARTEMPNLWDMNTTVAGRCQTNVSPLGSYHAGGICLHLFADGSVHGFSPNVSRVNIHWPLGCVLDGAPVTFDE